MIAADRELLRLLAADPVFRGLAARALFAAAVAIGAAAVLVATAGGCP